MSIIEMKKDLVSDIKGVDIEISALRRRFYSKLPNVPEEDVLHNEVFEYIIEHNNQLSKILNKIPELKNIDVNHIKVECWFYSNDVNKYCTIDLDDYYGAFEGYRYKLIVGGDNHGNFIMNGYHEDNANDMDIVYKLGDLNDKEYDTYTNALRDKVQTYFRYIEPIQKSNRKEIEAFSKYIRNHKLEMVTNIYKKLAVNYSYILDYSDGGREIYSVIMRYIDVLLTDINRTLNGVDVDHEYFARCRDLKTLVVKVQTDMHEWYENVDKYVDKIAKNNIGVSDVSQNILCFV